MFIWLELKNHQVVTEPGVITEVLQDAVKAKGLFYPPDPASKGSCFIGGNIAENSGGPKAVKYTDDLASCHSLSDEREYINGDEKS